MKSLEILKKLGISYIFITTPEKTGAYLDEFNLIYLSNNLSKDELENIILHETWHAMSKDFLTKLSSSQLKSIQEAKANQYMIHKRCEAYLSAFDNKPDYINIEGFLNYFNLDTNFYELAEREFRQLLA